jgi:phage gpG-like protein
VSLIGVHIDGGFHRLAHDLVTFQRTTALRLMAQAIADGIIERTDRGIDSQGQPFVPYAALTVALKSAKGQRTDPPTLRDTGKMLDSIRYVGNVLTVTDAEGADRARKHQFGGVDAGRVIPQRRFFDETEEDVRNGEAMIARALAGHVEAMDV